MCALIMNIADHYQVLYIYIMMMTVCTLWCVHVGVCVNYREG